MRNVEPEKLERALRRLSPKQREALELRAIHGWTFKEIGEHLGVSVKYANGLYHMAITLMRRYLP